MGAMIFSLLIFLLRFINDPGLAINSLKMPAKQMDVATIFPRGKAFSEKELSESSGLAAVEKNKLYTHNDSGGEAALFELDSNGFILQKINIPGADNIDWEDLAQDRERNILYIGDFGNNSNKRKDLKIYKIRNAGSKDSTSPEVINFNYNDQPDYPALNIHKNFDCEAFIYYKDSLILFTKNSLFGNGFTKRYSLPAVAGNSTASLVDSFPMNILVTAADISPDGKKLALLTYGAIYIFSDFPGNDFFKGNLLKINIPVSQTEAICFTDQNTIYYTNEEGFLYKTKLDRLSVKYYVLRYKLHNPKLKLVNNNKRKIIKIKLKEKDKKDLSITLLAPDGSALINDKEFNKNKLSIDTKTYSPGIYKLRISDTNGIVNESEIRIR